MQNKRGRKLSASAYFKDNWNGNNYKAILVVEMANITTVIHPQIMIKCLEVVIMLWNFKMLNDYNEISRLVVSSRNSVEPCDCNNNLTYAKKQQIL